MISEPSWRTRLAMERYARVMAYDRFQIELRQNRIWTIVAAMFAALAIALVASVVTL